MKIEQKEEAEVVQISNSFFPSRLHSSTKLPLVLINKKEAADL